LSKFAKAALFGLLIFMFFVLMSRIDYTINDALYDYGLKFSYGWAKGYWLAYNSVFLVFSSAVAAAYYLGSNKTRSELKVAVALFVTVGLLALGGLEDVLFFVLWGGGLPSVNVVWWWSPWIGIAGTWNSLIQGFLMVLTAFLSVLTWLIVLRKPKQKKFLAN
jgi:hypothetical protein